MYVIAGATGHVGSAAAESLLAAGEQVRVLVRDAAKADGWTGRGAQVAVVDLRNRAALADALRGANGFFALLPFDLRAADIEADQREVAEGLAAAVRESGVPHVAMLSSWGADLTDEPVLATWLGDLETRLRGTGATLSAVRSAHFHEKVEDVVGAAIGAGIYPVFSDSADKPVPMVATRDIGQLVAETLRNPPAEHQVVNISGPSYTERQVAEELGNLLGKDLDVVTIPRDGWVGTLVEAGLPEGAATLLADLYDADERGLLKPAGGHVVAGATPLEQTLRGLVSSAA